MAINHTALWTELGILFGAIKEANAWRDGTLVTREATIRTTYGTDANHILLTLQDDVLAAQASLDSWASTLSADVGTTIVGRVQDDQPLVDNVDDALVEWQRQLVNDGQNFQESPVTLTFGTATGAPAPTADFTFHTTALDTDGRFTDFGITDRYLITVLADADHGGTRWGETLSIVSKPLTRDPLDGTYATGVGLRGTYGVIDPNVAGGFVSDPTFGNYTAGTFDNWTRPAPLTVADVFQTADDPRAGATGFCATFKSDGTDVPLLKQTMNVSVSTVYSLHFSVKGINAALGTARVHVSLRRADTGAEITDDQGAILRMSSGTMTTLVGTGVWTHYVAAWATPSRLPAAGVYLDVRLADGTTPATPATVLTEARVDWVTLQEPLNITPRGVKIATYSYKVEPAVTDQWELGVALTSGVMSDYFIRWMDRTVGLAGRSFKLPMSGSATLDDSVIV